MNLHEKLQTIFDEFGANMNDQEELLEIDSVKYIAIMVEIEKEFGITIPDEYLGYNAFSDINCLIELVNGLTNNHSENDHVTSEVV